MTYSLCAACSCAPNTTLPAEIDLADLRDEPGFLLALPNRLYHP